MIQGNHFLSSQQCSFVFTSSLFCPSIHRSPLLSLQTKGTIHFYSVSQQSVKNSSLPKQRESSRIQPLLKACVCVCVCVRVCTLSCFSRVQLCATLWTIPRQAPLSMGFSRQDYWSGLPCLPPGDLPNLGTEPRALKSPALTGGFFTTSSTWEAPIIRV